MWQDSSIFLKREDKIKILGGTRDLNSSVSKKRQNNKCEVSFKMARNKFKQKALFLNSNLDLSLQKLGIQKGCSSYLTPNYKIPRKAQYKVCNSKNVCVFSNPRKVQSWQQGLQNWNLNISDVNNQLNYYGALKNSKQVGNFKPQTKKSQQYWISQATSSNFKLRKVSSSLSYRQKINSTLKVFDPWHNEDHKEDPDILFYK